jgi:hypothetical protein
VTFHYTDPDGYHLETATRFRADGTPVLAILTDDPTGYAMTIHLPLDRIEELVAGIRDTARQAAAQEPARLIKVDGVLTEGDANTAREAIQQMADDPYGLKAGWIVQPYRDHGQQKWVFRCWGTDTCDGWLSLDHTSQQSAERARDRHITEHHQEQPA